MEKLHQRICFRCSLQQLAGFPPTTAAKLCHNGTYAASILVHQPIVQVVVAVVREQWTVRRHSGSKGGRCAFFLMVVGRKKIMINGSGGGMTSQTCTWCAFLNWRLPFHIGEVDNES
jgi:hypothetical protein